MCAFIHVYRKVLSIRRLQILIQYNFVFKKLFELEHLSSFISQKFLFMTRARIVSLCIFFCKCFNPKSQLCSQLSKKYRRGLMPLYDYVFFNIDICFFFQNHIQ